MGTQYPNADHVRPETGARCGKAARRDLRGGRLATAVPTATIVKAANAATLTTILCGIEARPQEGDHDN